LGCEGHSEILCTDLSHLEDGILGHFTGKGSFYDLREIAHRLSRKDAAVLAYAKGLAEWNAGNAFCGTCGHSTRSLERGHSRICANASCARIIYPRIDPAVIVLIEYRPENGEPLCLLNRVKTSDGYRCSTFAGFVEVGESLENAVVREMKEEVDVDVKHITYVASQPWPFPSSVMIGFTAEVKTTAFCVDNEEIKDAAWYSAKEIRELAASGQLVLSKSDSIARSLIEHWVENNECVESKVR
ncbi:NAD(+) diphosphatase, partial [Sinomicrobium weinanense]